MRLLVRIILAAIVAPVLPLIVAAPAHADVTVYPVPTSDAGLGRIVTAPNGDMWFVERDTNQIGRITPGGVITEFDLPPTTTDDSWVMDLDVGADGRIWVAYDSGWKVAAVNPNGTIAYGPDRWAAPYAEDVRVGPANEAWVTMSYGDEGIVRYHADGSGGEWLPNAPECDGVALGIGRDGRAWCSQGQGLIRVDADANGGVKYPLGGDNLQDPFSLAAGPTGTIWFTRSWPGTSFTSPSYGAIGYLDAANGAVTEWQTGSRTAPRGLVRGPDGAMWFTDFGAASGAIGHVDAQGKGALSSVGAWDPHSLTFARDGAIWFTDRTNNAIIRVTTDQLQRTNVDPGEDSIFTQPRAAVGEIVVPTTPLRVRNGRVTLTVRCPAGSLCEGTALLRRLDGTAISSARSYYIPGGYRGAVKVALTRAGLRSLPRGRVTRVLGDLRRPGSARPAQRERLRVRR